jgi:glucose-1-phosphate thymidylyltransferase
MRKGIVLAGGSGSRLYPLTNITSKQLLPVYDKPMICYPVATLMMLGIKDILIISTPEDTPNIMKYFKDGSKLGLNIEYKIQDKPQGIAQAFTIGEDFIGDDEVCLILGDNIFYMGEQINHIRDYIDDNSKGATIFGYHVPDASRFGVIEFNEETKEVLSIEEKPAKPKSNYAAVGLYFYDNEVVKMAKNLKPSKRGELEITDINKIYLENKTLKAIELKRGTAWLDAGTPESLLAASNYVGMIEQRQGLKISCLEEIAHKMGYLDDEGLKTIISEIKDGADYKNYLKTVLAGK